MEGFVCLTRYQELMFKTEGLGITDLSNPTNQTPKVK